MNDNIGMDHTSESSLILIKWSQLYHLEIKNSQTYTPLHKGSEKLGILNHRLLLWVVGCKFEQKAIKTEKVWWLKALPLVDQNMQ